MKKGQGSLEYLLILAAILAIAVVVVVVANSMLNPGQEAGEAGADKYECALQGIELVNYNEAFAGTGTLSVNYGGESCSNAAITTELKNCKIGANNAYTLTVGEDAAGLCVFVISP